jgi:6-phosphogluconolactonase
MLPGTMTTFVYVGAYTGPGRAEGITVYRMEPGSGALTHVQTVGGIDNPSFLALDPGQRFLYAVSEVQDPGGRTGGAVSAFAVDPATGQLSFLNRQPSHGAGPCHVSVHQSGKYAFVANYGSGHVAALPIGDDGRLGEATAVVEHAGTGPIPRRQAGPHAHFISPDPTGALVLANDLGTDRVMVYRLDRAAGALVPNELPFAQERSGAGPRHLAFHPNGRFVFVLNEIDSTLSAFAYDAERGALRIVQTASTLPEDFSGSNSTAQVVMHPSGRFIYGSNRGHDSIVIFGVDGETGRMTYVGHEPTQGKTPRNFNLDPSGTLLLAANQNTHTIVAFRIDQDSGRLTATGQVTETPSPVCIVFRQA